jgi:hypothetical protein
MIGEGWVLTIVLKASETMKYDRHVMSQLC